MDLDILVELAKDRGALEHVERIMVDNSIRLLIDPKKEEVKLIDDTEDILTIKEVKKEKKLVVNVASIKKAANFLPLLKSDSKGFLDMLKEKYTIEVRKGPLKLSI